MASISTEPLNSRMYCTQCGGSFPAEDLAHFGNSVVCADCKPRFVQQMREGVATGRAVLYGGFWRRFLALIIDGIILAVVTVPVQMLVILPILRGSVGQPATPHWGLVGLEYLFGLALGATYQGYFLSQKSATPGKMVLGMKVLTAAGERLSVGRAVGRYFARIVSGLILCLGYIIAAFDPEKRALHDHICGTRVIRES